MTDKGWAVRILRVAKKHHRALTSAILLGAMAFMTSVRVGEVLAQPASPPPASEEDSKYTPSGNIQIDPKKFPLGSDKRVASQTLESLLRFEENLGIGAAVSHALKFRDPKTGEVRPEFFANARHPWSCGNKDTEVDWIADSMRIMFGTTGGAPMMSYFIGCMTPKTMSDLPRPTPHVQILIYADGITGFQCYLHTYGPDPPLDVPEIFERGNGLKADPTPEAFRDHGCCPSNKDVMEICEYEKYGYHMELLWPSHQIGLNDFNISAFDPTYECYNEPLTRSNLSGDQTYDKFLLDLFLSRHGIVETKENSVLPERTKAYLGQGRTAFTGMDAEDQTYSQEAHVYRTYLAHLAQINSPGNLPMGYDENCRCFFNAVEDRPQRIVTGWTEAVPHLPIWRTEELSSMLDYEVYKRSVPVSASEGPGAGGLAYYGKLDPAFPSMKSCASYRAARWPGAADLGVPGCYNYSQFGSLRENLYGDLISALRIQPMNEIAFVEPKTDFICGTTKPEEGLAKVAWSRQCLRGGGDVYPITGKLMGYQSELAAAALLAVRAQELFSRKGINDETRRINAIHENFDKLQRIYPLYPAEPENGANTPFKGMEPGQVSECFKTNGIPNYLLPESTYGHEREGDENWPKDGIRMDQLGEKRFVHWDRKRICMCPKAGRVLALKITCGFMGAQFDTGVKACARLPGASCMAKNNGDLGLTEVSWRTDGVSNGRPSMTYPVAYGPWGLPEGIPFPFFLPGGGESCPVAKPAWCGSSIRANPSKHGSFCGDAIPPDEET